MSPIDVVRRFCDEWPGLAPAEIGSFFADDCAYRHVSLARPLVGPRFIAGAIEIFRARFEQIECEVVHISSSDDVVLCERRDQFWLPGGRTFEIPGMATVLVREDRIAGWRDYFDLGALKSQVDVTEA